MGDDAVGGSGRLGQLALVALTLLLYAASLGHDFVNYDDPAYVTDHPVVRRGLSAEGLGWALTSTDYQYNWHPLTWWSHMLDVELFGLEPAGHHAMNVGLHALNVLLVLAVLRALRIGAVPAWLVAAIFALHPLRVESVAWVAERKDVLSGTFFFLTLLAYARWVKAPSAGRFMAVAGALALGLMAKPMLVTVPFVLLLLDGWPLGRWRGRGGVLPATSPTHPGRTDGARSGFELVREKWPLFLLVLISMGLTLRAQSAGGAVANDLALGLRLAHAPVAVWGYLAKAVWPFDLAVYYPHPALGAGAAPALGPALLAAFGLVLVSLLAYLARAARPWCGVGWLWFLGMLVPVLGLIQVGSQALADRYAYLPLIGLQLVLALALEELVRRRPHLRRAIQGAVLLLLAGLFLRSRDQLAHWRDSEALFRHARAVTERNHVAANNLGLLLGARGELEQAALLFERARDDQPTFYEAHRNLGKLRYGEGDFEGACASFARAVELRPGDAPTRFELAVCLARLARYDEAARELEEVERLEPAFVNDPRFQSVRQQLARIRGGD